MKRHLSSVLLFVFVGLIAQVVLAQVATKKPSQKTDGQKADKVSPTVKAFKEKILAAQTIVFLGDSNTNAGEYINVFETALFLQRPARLDIKVPHPQIINLGLPSETCCGLSEPIHPFPRPDVHERLARVIEKTKPNLVFACYGMNDGIYHPFSEERFKAFQDGIMKLVDAHANANIPLVLLTPPPFDPLPMKNAGKLVGKDAKEFSWKTIYKEYDAEVIEKYSNWMLTINKPDCLVINVHTPFKAQLAELRKTDPKLAFSNDGVHFDKRGHAVLANAMLKGLGFSEFDMKQMKANPKQLDKAIKVLNLVRQRRLVMHPAWLSNVGHKRPKVKAGLPLKEAKEKTKTFGGEIERALLKL